MPDLTGQVALVTGASRGVGRGMAVAGIDASGFRIFGPATAHDTVTLTGLPSADPHVVGQLWEQCRDGENLGGVGFVAFELVRPVTED